MAVLPSSYTDADRSALDALGIEEVIAEFENYDPSAEHVVDAGDMLCYLVEHDVFPLLTDPDLANDAALIQTAEYVRINNIADPDLTVLISALTDFLNDSGHPVSTSSDNQSFIDEWNAAHPDQATTGSSATDESSSTATSTTVTADDMIAYYFRTGNIASAIGIFITGMDVTEEDGSVTHKDGFQETVQDSLDNLLDQYDEQLAQLQDYSDRIASGDVTSEEFQLELKTIDIGVSNVKSQIDLTSSTMKTVQDCLNTLIQFKSDETQKEGSLTSQIISNLRG